MERVTADAVTLFCALSGRGDSLPLLCGHKKVEAPTHSTKTYHISSWKRDGRGLPPVVKKAVRVKLLVVAAEAEFGSVHAVAEERAYGLVVDRMAAATFEETVACS